MIKILIFQSKPFFFAGDPLKCATGNLTKYTCVIIRVHLTGKEKLFMPLEKGDPVSTLNLYFYEKNKLLMKRGKS